MPLPSPFDLHSGMYLLYGVLRRICDFWIFGISISLSVLDRCEGYSSKCKDKEGLVPALCQISEQKDAKKTISNSISVEMCDVTLGV